VELAWEKNKTKQNQCVVVVDEMRPASTYPRTVLFCSVLYGYAVVFCGEEGLALLILHMQHAWSVWLKDNVCMSLTSTLRQLKCRSNGQH